MSVFLCYHQQPQAGLGGPGLADEHVEGATSWSPGWAPSVEAQEVGPKTAEDCVLPKSEEGVAASTQIEKENDSLLNKSGNGSFAGPRYGEVRGGPPPEGPVPTLGGSNPEGSISTSSATRDVSRRTSRDRYLQRISEEEAPQTDCKRKVLKYVVTVLFIIIVVGIVVIWSMHEGRSKKHQGNQYFDFIAKKRVINVYNDKDNVILTGFIKASAPEDSKTLDCDAISDDDSFCFYFDDKTVFKFETYQLVGSEVNCLNLAWEGLDGAEAGVEDCYDIEYGLWYGLPNFLGPFWPLQPNYVMLDPISYRPYQNRTLGHVLEGFWLSTMGVAIIAHQNLPLKVSFNSGNNKRLCVALDTEGLLARPYPSVNYSLCQGPDIKQTFVAARNHFFPQTEIIDFQNHDLSQILWTYQDRYSSHGDNVGSFLHKVSEAELPIHMLEFDSQWQKHPGDFLFETGTRNELSQYFQRKYSKTKLMLPITLACSYLSANFFRGVKERMFGKDPQTQSFQTLMYKDEDCAIWDASNPSTRYFLREAVRLLRPSDDLAVNKYPQAFEFRSTVGSSVYPLLLYSNSSQVNMLDVTFLNILLALNKSVLMQTAFRMQDKPIFVEIPTLIANRDSKKCLDYIITGALTAGIHGYPYVTSLPPPEDKVDEELFMRWLEIATFFPGLKMTSPALKFGNNVKDLTKNISSIRESLVIKVMVDFVQDIAEGLPLIRPLWWPDPNDYKTLRISDQFLVGDSLLVAPILCHGDRKRDIYLPDGSWVHYSTGRYYAGRQWLRDFDVALSEIPVFQAIEEEISNTTDNAGLTETYS